MQILKEIKKEKKRDRRGKTLFLRYEGTQR